MTEGKSSPFPYAAAADELRREELARLRAVTMPSLEGLRSLAPAELQIEIADMLDCRGYTLVAMTDAGDLIVTKDDRKLVVACARPPEPVRQQAIVRLHEAIIAANAAEGFYVTARSFEPGAVAYASSLPITLVDGDKLLASLTRSKTVAPPDHYKGMCRICGAVVTHHFGSSIALPCGRGHLVGPTIARAAIFPEPAKAPGGDSEAAPSARTRRGRPMTPKAVNRQRRRARMAARAKS